MKLHLFIPDLFWPDSSQTDIYRQLELPALEVILSKSSRGQTAAGQSPESWLCKNFNVDKQQDWPVASILLQHEKKEIEVGESYWLRVDPVHLRIENNHMLLGDNQILNISLKEAVALADNINTFFSDDGVTVLPLYPDRWYLKCNQIPELQTALLSEAVGKNINYLLPQGKDGAVWNSRINEIQMLFYDHPVNRDREMRGELAINSVWIWGGGTRPAKVHASCAKVWSNHELACALAEMGRIKNQVLPKDANRVLEQMGVSGEQLIILDSLRKYACYRDAYEWRNELVEMEEKWFSPLLQMLRKKQIQELRLTVTNENSTRDFILTPSMLWKFWAAVRPVETYRYL